MNQDGEPAQDSYRHRPTQAPRPQACSALRRGTAPFPPFPLVIDAIVQEYASALIMAVRRHFYREKRLFQQKHGDVCPADRRRTSAGITSSAFASPWSAASPTPAGNGADGIAPAFACHNRAQIALPARRVAGLFGQPRLHGRAANSASPSILRRAGRTNSSNVTMEETGLPGRPKKMVCPTVRRPSACRDGWRPARNPPCRARQRRL